MKRTALERRLSSLERLAGEMRMAGMKTAGEPGHQRGDNALDRLLARIRRLRR
jgi:hypothetical protein